MVNNKYNILIVDDEKKICNILSEILTDEGYSVSFAYNGSDALKIVEKNNVEIILLDLKLPDTNGITLLKKIKKMRPDISIVMISAFGTEEIAMALDFVENHIAIIEEEGIERAKEKFERDFIISVLNRTGWKIGKTAKLLKIDRSSLFRKMKKYNIYSTLFL